LKDAPEVVPAGFVDDFESLVLAAQFTNHSDYLGYGLTMNAGVRWERQAFKEATQKGSLLFLRVFAGLGD
jgi:hypothetical protein